MKRALISAMLAVAVCVFGSLGYETARFVTTSPDPSSAPAAKPLREVQVDPSWIKAGTPRFTQTEISRSPDGRTTSGIWVCEGPTTFVWQFAVDEVVYVLEGEVKIDYQGTTFVLQPGDSAAFHGGTSATWRIDQRLKKAYTLHNPGPLGRLWRSLFPAA